MFKKYIASKITFRKMATALFEKTTRHPAASYTGQRQRPCHPFPTLHNSQRPINPSQTSMNPTLMSMNLTQTSMNPTQTSMNLTQTSMNPTLMSMNPSQTSMNPSQTSMNLTQTSVNLTQTSLNPSRKPVYDRVGSRNCLCNCSNRNVLERKRTP